MSDFHKLSIKNIIRETPKAVSIEFDIPKDLNTKYTFSAGKYITIKTKVDGKEIRRAYSICSSPSSGTLKVAVKQIADGVFSAIANTQLKTGDILEVHIPEGNFVLQTDPKASNTYAAFVAGSGITPVMSMIKAVMEEEPNSKFVLIYGNQTPEETIFANELTALQSQYGDRLAIEWLYSRSDIEGARFGRIDRSIVNYIVKNKFKNSSFNNFYLCGPENMIATIKDTLIENGVSENLIHFELFTSSANDNTASVTLEGKTAIKIIVDDEEFNFEMDQKKTILDAALEKDIDAPYSCQGGVCSSCICKVTEGEAVMENNNILTDEELSDGLVLACQAHPTTSTIHIDFDDV